MRLAGFILALTACVAPHSPGGADTDALRGDRGVCGQVALDPQQSSEPRWVAIAGENDLAVYVEDTNTPVAGQMVRGRDGLVFWPAFPFTPGVQYRVRGERCATTFEIPADSRRPGPTVVAIYPTSHTIPENILRFYIYFSEPMAEGNFLDHLRLKDAETGQDITGVFFDSIYELWSADRKRITLLVDPGRVKTGLQAHIAHGRAFAARHTYELHVLPSWTSVDGRPLSQGATKIYRAVPEDRTPIDPRAWQLRLPAPGTRDPLVVRFGEPVDHVSVSHFLKVLSPHNDELPGTWHLSPGEHTARWEPQRAWLDPIEEYSLVVNGRFEDIVGNNLNAAFDHRVGELTTERESRPVIRPLGEPSQTRPPKRLK